MNIKSLFLDSLKIAILTASTGAAIRDIQSTIVDILWPKNPNKYFSTRYTSQRGYIIKILNMLIHLALILLYYCVVVVDL